MLRTLLVIYIQSNGRSHVIFISLGSNYEVPRLCGCDIECLAFLLTSRTDDYELEEEVLVSSTAIDEEVSFCSDVLN